MADSEKFFEGFLDDYFAECDEHIVSASRALADLEPAIGTPDAQRALVDELFRHFHSLKGISAMVELRPAEQLAHHLEHYLRAIRDGEIALTLVGLDVMIDATRRHEEIVAAFRARQPVPSIEDLVTRLATQAAAATPAPAPAVPTPSAPASAQRWLCRFTPTHDLVARGVGVDSVRRRLGEIGVIRDAAPRVGADGAITFEFVVEQVSDRAVFEALKDDAILAEELSDAPPASEAAIAGSAHAAETVPSPSASASHVVRVDLARLDELMQHVGDLVISRARLADTLAPLEAQVSPAAWRAVLENATVIDRQLRSLREGIMRIRLVPVGEIFRRMPFAVRDLARENGKKVVLDLRGQSTEIDKFLIERMMDPVLHLVRNAVSHGIETPDERMARGKSPEGTITLSGSAAGDVVTIEVSDDGRGVDAGAVAARAREKRLPVPDGALDAPALLALLCSPGFSTKDEADRASGRGVGMAVVKSTVDSLSGSLTMTTEPGAGTRFTIQLPLTLAIADALIGRVGAESFAVPQVAVREVITVSTADLRLVEQNELAPYRDGALPIVRLSRLFDIRGAATDRLHVFVIGRGSKAVGLAVDRIVGQREIVVRAVLDPLVRVDGVAGATDLGDGRVVLILDPAALARMTSERAVRTLGDAAVWGRAHA